MKLVRTPLVVFIIGLILVIAISATQYQTNLSALDVQTTDKLGSDGRLPHESLMQLALDNAKLWGLKEDLKVDDLSAFQFTYTTVREWEAFTGGDTEAEPGDLGAETIDRPLFVIDIRGSGFRPVGSSFYSEPPEYYSMTVVLYADTGELSATVSTPVGVETYDLSRLK